MNRSQRRKVLREGREVKKETVINIKASDLEKIKEDAAIKAAHVAFVLMLGIPTMVIHDKYHLLMKRVVDGKSREERFCDLCLDLYESFEQGYLTLEDMHKCLYEEAGIKIE